MIRHPHALRWLDSLTLDELKRWVIKNSCLCDMAGECNGCQLADAEHRIRRLEARLVEASPRCGSRTGSIQCSLTNGHVGSCRFSGA